MLCSSCEIAHVSKSKLYRTSFFDSFKKDFVLGYHDHILHNTFNNTDIRFI